MYHGLEHNNYCNLFYLIDDSKYSQIDVKKGLKKNITS